jgi:Ca2+-binding RTX toxin-like protein
VITNTGTAGNINGGDGDDIITNSGTVTDMLLGGAGNDTITNTGAINGLLNAGAGNDTIDTSGPTGHLLGDDGDDTFTLRDGATVAGVLIGGNGYDILRFAFTVYSNDYPPSPAPLPGPIPWAAR